MAIQFSESVEVHRISLLRVSMIDLLFYQEDEIAEFRNDALAVLSLADSAEVHPNIQSRSHLHRRAPSNPQVPALLLHRAFVVALGKVQDQLLLARRS